MTLVGKIFTMLILVMSVVFMAFSVMVFATHKNWKDEATKLQAQLNTLQTSLKEAEDLRTRLQAQLAQEQAARRSALASLQVRAVRAEQTLAAKEKELADLSAAHSKVAEAARDAQTRLATLEDETRRLRDDLRGAQKDRDEVFIQVVDLTEKLNQAESLRQLLDERNKEAAFQLAQMKMVLDRHGLAPDALVAHIPPKVDGVVLEVSGKDLIEISIGADDGLKVGHALDVYRDSTYLGRIVIRKTGPDRAVGQILKELQRGQIKRGDRVTTRFS